MSETRWVNQVVESIPDHSSNVAKLIKQCMESELLDIDTKNSIAYVAALSSGNAELAFEIEMSSLSKSPLRETLKGLVSEMSVRNKIQDFISIFDIQIGSFTSHDTELLDQYKGFFNHTFNKDNYIYCLAISIAQSSKLSSHYYYQKLESEPTEKLNVVILLSSAISSINKITL